MLNKVSANNHLDLHRFSHWKWTNIRKRCRCNCQLGKSMSRDIQRNIFTPNKYLIAQTCSYCLYTICITHSNYLIFLKLVGTIEPWLTIIVWLWLILELLIEVTRVMSIRAITIILDNTNSMCSIIYWTKIWVILLLSHYVTVCFTMLPLLRFSLRITVNKNRKP